MKILVAGWDSGGGAEAVQTVVGRAADALGQVQVRGLVTTGPAVDPAVISAPPNVEVTRWVRHADVLPVLLRGRQPRRSRHRDEGADRRRAADRRPLGRDQPDNAARVVYAGAGIRLRKHASVARSGWPSAGSSEIPATAPPPAHGGPAGCRARRRPRC